MALTSAQVAVTATATLLFNASDAYDRVVLKNTGANPVFVGPSGVTATTGFELAVGATLVLAAVGDSSDDFYGVCGATLSSTVHVLTY